MTSEKRLPIDPRILEAASKITGKRPKTVVDHILKHGFITTEELKDLYGYSHPPRAIRDVREAGVPLVTYTVRDKTARAISAYKFADPSMIVNNKIGGRQTFSKTFKQSLLARDGSHCALCSQIYEDRYLTIDHRVPYEVSGDANSGDRKEQDFMLLCGTCQRKKSWSCEKCDNWVKGKDISVCNQCYWAQPANYAHLAGQQIRRLEIVWADKEVSEFESLRTDANDSGLTIQEFLKRKLNTP